MGRPFLGKAQFCPQISFTASPPQVHACAIEALRMLLPERRMTALTQVFQVTGKDTAHLSFSQKGRQCARNQLCALITGFVRGFLVPKGFIVCHWHTCPMVWIPAPHHTLSRGQRPCLSFALVDDLLPLSCLPLHPSTRAQLTIQGTVLCFLLFPTLYHLLGRQGDTGRQEERLSPGQVNVTIFPDRNWAEVFPVED